MGGMKASTRNSRAAATLLVVLTLVLAACGSSSKSSSGDATTTTSATRPNVTFQAAEYGFGGPSTVPAGYVDITLHNTGKQDHQAAIAKVGASTTIAQV